MANFFSNLGLFKKQDGSVLGVDIGSLSIKVVQLKRQGGRAVLETYGELSLGPYNNASVGQAVSLHTDKLVEALKDLLNEPEVKITTRSCGIAIPFASSLISVMEMPALSMKQLSQMVPIEARKYIPVPITEVTLDWSIIPQERNDNLNDGPLDEMGRPVMPKAEVLTVAIHNSTLEKYREIITKSGLDATFFEIEIFSTMRAVLDQETTPIMIVDMGAMTTKLYIVERGVLRGSHTINSGSQNITDTLSKALSIPMPEAEIIKREKGLTGVTSGVGLNDIITVPLDYIFSEAGRVVLAYQKKYNKNVAKVILVGGGSALMGITDVAKQNFQTEVVAGNPISKVVVPAFLEEILRQTGPEFAVAVGIALRKLQESD